ncbi:hypothetical protein Tco_0193004 [Tanacetum coccineum]
MCRKSRKKMCVKDADKEVSTANPVTTAGEVVTTASEAVTTAGGEDSVAPTILITAATTPQILKDELTLAQTLMKTKAAKPKAITTSATTTTSNVIRPKARGVVVQEPSEFRTTTTVSSQLPQTKDKGKAKMIEPKKPLKRKDQIAADKEIARRLEA